MSPYLYLQQLYDSGTAHTPDSVSLCSSHQTRPRMPASVCLAALEVPSFVVSIYLCVGHGLVERSRVEFVSQCKGILLQVWVCTYLYLQQLYDSGTAHTPDSVSLCSSHQTRSSMPASVVVGICALGMISWNALQDTQPCNHYNCLFFVGALLLFTPIYLLQATNQLLDVEYSIQCSNTVVWYSIPW